MPTAASKRRKSRILIVAGAAVLLAGGAATFMALRQRQLDGRALEARERGRTALLAGDWPAAMDGLGTYILRFRVKGTVTGEEYLQYAKARRRVAMPNNEHMAGALGNLRKAYELAPDSRAVQDELLDVYFSVGFATEALELIDKMLASTPSDVGLLTKKCDLLEAVREFPKALEVARRIHELQPDDLAGPVRTLRLMLRAGTAASSVDLWLAAVTTAHPDDPRFDLLRAAAFTRRQETEKAREVLDRVVARAGVSKDPKFLALLLGELDAAERWDDSLRVIDQIEATDEPALRREVLRRLWYADRGEDVVSRSAPWSIDLAVADAEILGLRALTLCALDRSPESDPIAKALAARSDELSRAWGTLISRAVRHGEGDPAMEMKALAAATRTESDSAILLLALGDARAALGELDAAILTWSTAAVLAPAWARPHCRIAEALCRTERPMLAFAPARAALRRSPSRMEAISTWMSTMSELAGRLDEKQVAQLLDGMEQIRKSAPEASRNLVPIEIRMLARTDRRKAEIRLKELLDAPEGLSEDSLLQLARTAHDAELALEDQFLEVSERLHGVTPRLALARATVRARTAGFEAGLKVIDDLRARAGASAKPLEWDVVRTSFLEVSAQPGAGPAWIALADANPTSLTPQLGALACGWVWRDTAAVDRIIERVRAATGDEGVSWRTARARRLLTDAASAPAQFEEAQKLLDGAVRVAPGNTSARLLLAQCLERLGDVKGAEEQLRAAASLAPDDPSTSIEMARLAQQGGRIDEARRQLDRALRSPQLGALDLERAAFLLAAQGDIGRSADLLVPLTNEDRLGRRGLLLLTDLRMRLGDFGGALQVCERLLDTPDAEVLAMAAELYATVGRAADAQAALAKLDAMEAKPGDRERTRARVAARGNDGAAADAAFRQAAAAAPDRADIWTEYAVFAVLRGDAKALDWILDQSASQASDRVQVLSQNRELATEALVDPPSRLLLLSAMSEATDRVVLLETVRVLSESRGQKSGAQAAAVRVGELAVSNPRVLGLQILASDMSAQAGRLKEASEIAVRAMAQFAMSAVTAQQAAELFARRGMWREAIDAAVVWRSRAGRRDAQPDLFLATALLQVERPMDALNVLEPRAAQWLAAPEQFEDALVTYLVVLVRARKSERAAEVLDGLAAHSPRWRTRALDVRAEWLRDPPAAHEWLLLCGKVVPDDDAAARVRLARAWASAWERFRSTELLAGTRRLLAELTALPDAPGDVWYIGAVIAERQKDLPGARRGYQAALDRDPANAAARNNLAMIQADTGEVDAAIENGKKLVAENPRVAEFLDTLAYAYRRGKRWDEAKAQMEAAIGMDPLNLGWRVGLAEILSESGGTADAMRVVATVEEMAAAGTVLTPDLRGRLDKVKAQRK